MYIRLISAHMIIHSTICMLNLKDNVKVFYLNKYISSQICVESTDRFENFIGVAADLNFISCETKHIKTYVITATIGNVTFSKYNIFVAVT